MCLLDPPATCGDAASDLRQGDLIAGLLHELLRDFLAARLQSCCGPVRHAASPDDAEGAGLATGLARGLLAEELAGWPLGMALFTT